MALSSTEPADFPLPRTALELGFDLVALRAPCRAEPSRGVPWRQDRPRGDCCKLRQLFLRLPQPPWTVGCRRGPCSSVDRRGHGLGGRCRPDAARGGGRSERPAELAGARPGARAGRDGAPARLVLRAPDPRPVARRLGVPEGARGVQPDVRRRAPPGDAGRGRRVLLARPGRAAAGVAAHAANAPRGDGRGAGGLVRRRRDDPRRARRLRGRGSDRRASRGAVADRDRPRALRRPALGRRPPARAAGDGRARAP